MKAVPRHPVEAPFTFQPPRVVATAVGESLELPVYPTGRFMWAADGRRAEVHVDSVATMEELGWSLTPPAQG